MDLEKNFADYLKQYRINNAMTQEDLAKKLNTTKQVICNYENGKHTPKVHIAAQIASALNVPLWEMLGVEDKDYREEQLLLYYRSLSEEGQDKLIERAAEMVFIYGKKNKKVADRKVL